MKKVNPYYVIVVLFIALASLYLFSGNCHKTEKPVIIPITDQVKKVEKSEASRIPVVTDSLRIILARDSAIIILKAKLQKSEFAAKQASKIISDLSEITPGKTEPIYKTDPEDYYTREQAIKDLQASSRQASEDCNETISQLDAQIISQQKVISVKDSMYMDLRKAFNTSMDQQQALGSYAKKLEKQSRKDRAGKFLLKGLTVGLAGALIYSAVK